MYNLSILVFIKQRQQDYSINNIFYVGDDITYTASDQVILKLNLDFKGVLIYVLCT